MTITYHKSDHFPTHFSWMLEICIRVHLGLFIMYVTICKRCKSKSKRHTINSTHDIVPCSFPPSRYYGLICMEDQRRTYEHTELDFVVYDCTSCERSATVFFASESLEKGRILKTYPNGSHIKYLISKIRI